MHLLLAAVPEDGRVGAAAVEAEHDRRPGRDGPGQLGQRLGQRDGQSRGLAGHEAHRPPVCRGHVRVRAAPLRPAPLVVPPFRDRLGAGVGDEVVIDVVHPGGLRAGRQHRGRERRLQLQRVSGTGHRGQRRPQRPQRRQGGQPGQRPGLGRGQVLDLLGGGRSQREAHAHRRQQGSLPRLAARRVRQDLPGPPGVGVQQHRPGIPGEHPAALRRSRRPAEPGRHDPRLRPRHQRWRHRLLLVWLRHGLRFRPRRLVLPARRRATRSGSFVQLQLALHPGRAELLQHRGLLHPQPAGDLRVPHPLPAPRPGPLPVLPGHRAGPAPRPDQPGGPLPLRPLVQRGHVVRGQPQRRRHLRAGETELPQRRHRDVPHPGITVGEPEQRGLPGEDPRHPVRAQHPQVSSFRHALQDGRRGGRRHTPIVPLVNAFNKKCRTYHPRSGRAPVLTFRRSGERRDNPARRRRCESSTLKG